MIVNIQTPKCDNLVEDGINYINKVNQLFKSKWEYDEISWDFSDVIDYNLMPYFEYFKYVDSQLTFILNNRSILSIKAKELFILRERLVRILNPKIQLLIYNDSLDENKIRFYSIVTHLNENGSHNISEIELDNLLPEGCDELNLPEYLSEKFIREIKVIVFEYLKTTIEVPTNIDFVYEMQKLSHHNDTESVANYFLDELKKSIEILEIEEFENINVPLYKRLKAIKINSSRLFNKLETLDVLDLSLKRL